MAVFSKISDGLLCYADTSLTSRNCIAHRSVNSMPCPILRIYATLRGPPETLRIIGLKYTCWRADFLLLMVYSLNSIAQRYVIQGFVSQILILTWFHRRIWCFPFFSLLPWTL